MRFLSHSGLLALLSCLACGSAPEGGKVLAADAGVQPPLPDAAPVEDESAPCEASGLQEQALGEQRVGDFRISSAAEFVVRHEGDTRELFRSSDILLQAARGTLHVEEGQGSFAVEESEDILCSARGIDSAFASDSTLELRGGFEAGASACQNLEFRLRLCQVREGHLRFELETNDSSFNRLELRSSSSPEERIYGMGQQVPHASLNLKGRTIPVLVQEGGVGRGHLPISPAVEAVSPGSSGGESSTYYAAPHYLTSDNRSLFLENTEYALFDFSRDEEIRMRVHAPSVQGRILYGTSPLELIELFTAYAGRMPVPPSWVNEGAIVALAKDTASSMSILGDLKARGVEIAAIWNQTWSGTAETFIGEQVLWNWISNPFAHPEWQSYVEGLQQEGIRMLCYVNPMLRDIDPLEESHRRNLFAEARDAEYLIKNEAGDAYIFEATAFDVGLIDLSNPQARTWMKDVLKEELMSTGGCDGWMADFAEALPFDALLYSGEPASSYHNRYPVEWIKLHREAVEESGKLGEVLIFNRSGHTQTPRHSMLLWQGDQLTTWDRYDGMVSAIRGLISGGLSGIALNHSDIGGYTSLSRFGLGYRREALLLKRWTELSAFTSIMRTHEGNQPAANAQIYSDQDSMDHFARFTKVYKALAFYREDLFAEANERGWPVVRHMMLEYPQDPQAHEEDLQFMLGSEILIAPILNKCFTAPICPYNKDLYLPAGDWVHLWSGEVFAGNEGRRVQVQAPLGSPAVFYKRDSNVGAAFVQNLQSAGIEVTDPS